MEKEGLAMGCLCVNETGSEHEERREYQGSAALVQQALFLDLSPSPSLCLYPSLSPSLSISVWLSIFVCPFLSLSLSLFLGLYHLSASLAPYVDACELVSPIQRWRTSSGAESTGARKGGSCCGSYGADVWALGNGGGW